MLDPHSTLGQRLAAHRVRVGDDGPGSVILKGVPANRRFFTKPGTNLMVKQALPHLSFLIAVDEDLSYLGSDPVLSKAFTAATTRQGWRILPLHARAGTSLDVVVEGALRVVGFDGAEPCWTDGAPTATSPTVDTLSHFATDVVTYHDAPVPSRREAVAELATALLALQPRLVLVVGEPGVGKTHLVGTLSARLQAIEPGIRLRRVDVGQLFAGTMVEAEREQVIAALLADLEVASDDVLVLERGDLVISETHQGALLLARALERGVRVVALAVPAGRAAFDVPALARHLHVCELNELPVDETCAIVRGALPAIAAHSRVRMSETLAETVVECATALWGMLPAKALALADAACTRARVDEAGVVDIAHIYIAACAFRGAGER